MVTIAIAGPQQLLDDITTTIVVGDPAAFLPVPGPPNQYHPGLALLNPCAGSNNYGINYPVVARRVQTLLLRQPLISHIMIAADIIFSFSAQI